jgi:hypothetical protein
MVVETFSEYPRHEADGGRGRDKERGEEGPTGAKVTKAAAKMMMMHGCCFLSCWLNWIINY